MKQRNLSTVTNTFLLLVRRSKLVHIWTVSMVFNCLILEITAVGSARYGGYDMDIKEYVYFKYSKFQCPEHAATLATTLYFTYISTHTLYNKV